VDRRSLLPLPFLASFIIISGYFSSIASAPLGEQTILETDLPYEYDVECRGCGSTAPEISVQRSDTGRDRMFIEAPGVPPGARIVVLDPRRGAKLGFGIAVGLFGVAIALSGRGRGRSRGEISESPRLGSLSSPR
jgi:hypothetical protein